MPSTIHRFEALAFFHGDDAVLAHFVHGFGNDLADLGILWAAQVPPGDLLGVTHGLAHLASRWRWRRRRCRCRVHFVGVGGGDVLPFGEDGFGVDRCGGGAVTGILGACWPLL